MNDKQFMSRYLEYKHIAKNESLVELCEVLGLDAVRKIMSECEALRLFVPSLSNNRELIYDIIKDNPDMSERELARRTGCSLYRIHKYRRELNVK